MKSYNYEEAKAAFKQYPFLVAPAVSALNGATPEERSELVRRIAAAVCDEADLRAIIGMDPAEFADFYPDTRNREVSTNDTIDTFLEKFSTPEKSATPELETMVTAPAIDYAAMMLEQEDGSMPDPDEEDSTASMISSFLNAVPPKTVKKREPAQQPAQPAAQKEESPALSESLARMMIKNGNYRKALEIITDLSLKNPKKSIYFADQMRFLKKLIQNQQKSEEEIADN